MSAFRLEERGAETNSRRQRRPTTQRIMGADDIAKLGADNAGELGQCEYRKTLEPKMMFSF